MARRSWIGLVVATSAALLATAVTSVPATSAPTTYKYSGTAGGTFVNVLGGAVRSDLTAGSYLVGTDYPASTSNTTLGVDVAPLLSVGVVETSGDAAKTLLGSQQVMRAETARVSLLNDLIKADALETTTTARSALGGLSGESKTTLVGLTIAGQKIPVSVPKNTKINVPGVVEVTINESTAVEESGGIKVTGSALKVRLLKAIDGSEPGTVITINPTTASLLVPQPTDVTKVGGYAYVTKVDAGAANADLRSGPTSYIAAPPTGTNGFTNVVSLLRVTLPNLLEAGVVESTSTASSVPVTADVTHTAEVARLKLLGGLVTADAVKVEARVRKLPDGTIVREPSTKIVNLRLAGVPIKLDVKKANVGLKLPGILSIVVNEQTPTANGVTVVGLHVKVLSRADSEGAGADVKIAVAHSEAG